MLKLFYSFILLASFAFFQNIYAIKTSKTPYIKNPYVTDAVWNTLTPYFIPSDSHERAVLDRIFLKKRVLSSLESLEKLGFYLLTGPERAVFIALHQKLKGYIIKGYLDTYEIDEAYWLMRRAEGSKRIQASISAHGFEQIMKVPKKWIYPLPIESEPKKGHGRRNFLLLCEKMDILEEPKYLKAYKKKMTFETLQGLYVVISENLLIDSVFPDNIPFCKDGKIAFIDTEHFDDTSQQIPFEVLNKYLSEEMAAHWQRLILETNSSY